MVGKSGGVEAQIDLYSDKKRAETATSGRSRQQRTTTWKMTEPSYSSGETGSTRQATVSIPSLNFTGT
ncbi:hypothetical protein PanWU01x14_011770 [Parasponia andersonii]|uniref:Uncharacterized protein n=1 Tax=Parasponia andersonii TaxID=3476 RepID=A0A2P5E1M7_PARAD|nr:hypothetical protein PanWU01x14_011770 [Parasponia andersonii]